MARTSCLAAGITTRRREGSEVQPALLGVELLEGSGGWCRGSFSYLLQLHLHFFLGSADTGAGADDADGKWEIALFGFPNAITMLRDIQVQAGCCTSNPQMTTTLRGSWALTIECHRRPPGLAIGLEADGEDGRSILKGGWASFSPSSMLQRFNASTG